MAARASSPLASVRHARTTVSPRAASCFAAERPTPELAPVTRIAPFAGTAGAAGASTPASSAIAGSDHAPTVAATPPRIARRAGSGAAGTPSTSRRDASARWCAEMRATRRDAGVRVGRAVPESTLSIRARRSEMPTGLRARAGATDEEGTDAANMTTNGSRRLRRRGDDGRTARWTSARDGRRRVSKSPINTTRHVTRLSVNGSGASSPARWRPPP